MTQNDNNNWCDNNKATKKTMNKKKNEKKKTINKEKKWVKRNDFNALKSND